MTTKLRILPVIVVGVLVAAAGVAYNKLPTNVSGRQDDNTTTFVTTWDNGGATMLLNIGDGRGDQRIYCPGDHYAGTHTNKGCSKGRWSRTYEISPPAMLSIIITSDNVVNTSCSIRRKGVANRPPAQSPKSPPAPPSNTRHCVQQLTS